MFRFCNPNPRAARVGDCTVRALSIALGRPWRETYRELCDCGDRMADMPSSNAVWGSMLRQHGWRRHAVPDEFGDCYTVADFAADHPRGRYILGIPGHVVCLIDGDWMDTFNSGDEVPTCYWKEV